MKLIIDIPQTAYDAIQTIKEIESTNNGTLENVLIKAVENGIPLDKIKAEIAEYKDDKVIHYERNEMIDIVLGIIDKCREEVSD